MSNFTIQDKPFNLPDSSSGFTADQSQRWPLRNLMLMPLVFVENTGGSFNLKVSLSTAQQLVKVLQTKSIPPALQYHLLDCKTALENGWSNSGHSYQLSWPVGMRTLGRQIGVLQQFTVLDGLNPPRHSLQLSSLHTWLPGPAPGALPAFPVTWYTLHLLAI